MVDGDKVVMVSIGLSLWGPDLKTLEIIVFYLIV